MKKTTFLSILISFLIFTGCKVLNNQKTTLNLCECKGKDVALLVNKLRENGEIFQVILYGNNFFKGDSTRGASIQFGINDSKRGNVSIYFMQSFLADTLDKKNPLDSPKFNNAIIEDLKYSISGKLKKCEWLGSISK